MIPRIASVLLAAVLFAFSLILPGTMSLAGMSEEDIQVGYTGDNNSGGSCCVDGPVSACQSDREQVYQACGDVAATLTHLITLEDSTFQGCYVSNKTPGQCSPCGTCNTCTCTDSSNPASCRVSCPGYDISTTGQTSQLTLYGHELGKALYVMITLWKIKDDTGSVPVEWSTIPDCNYNAFGIPYPIPCIPDPLRGPHQN